MKYLLITIFFCSCVSPKKNQKDAGMIDLLGTWCLTERQINYPSLTFQKDSIAIFTSFGDTIYSFRYYQKNNTLNLTTTKGIIRNEIIKHTKDSLIFKNLIEHGFIQRYYRCTKIK